jgi:hypothetical protein
MGELLAVEWREPDLGQQLGDAVLLLGAGLHQAEGADRFGDDVRHAPPRV